MVDLILWYARASTDGKTHYLLYRRIQRRLRMSTEQISSTLVSAVYPRQVLCPHVEQVHLSGQGEPNIIHQDFCT